MQLKQHPPSLKRLGAAPKPLFSSPGGFQVIAEVKKASPSEGVLREDFDPTSIAQAYAKNGAGALSVLTDEKFFQGKGEYLTSIHRALDLPILRKDFILDPLQIDEAYNLGADGLLLIVALLTLAELRNFTRHAQSLGMFVLTEVHDALELETALEAGAEIIGVNNRNLKTFQISLETSFLLGESIPKEVRKISESGLTESSQLLNLKNAGFDGVLIGSHFIRQASPGLALKKILLGIH